MNKRILISLSVIGAVAAIAVGGTIAYFSDTETSTGNTFTAGKLDLIIDINGVDQNPLVDTLFNLTDMKPGDSGEKTLSLRVDNNPACGFVDITMDDDFDNDCTEPEGQDEMMGGGAESTPGCDAVGELNDAINWMIWKETDCDNIYDEGEGFIVSGPLTEGISYAIGELPTIQQGQICYGLAYCFGTWMSDGSCDGSVVNNVPQSDSFAGDLTITAEQKRNQYDGSVGSIAAECPVGPVVVRD